MLFSGYYQLNILNNFYVFIFFLFTFLINELPVNEEFYISLGLLGFLISIKKFSIKALFNYLNVQVKAGFFIFRGLYKYLYTSFVDLFFFFKFDLYFFVLLYNLSKLIYFFNNFFFIRNMR